MKNSKTSTSFNTNTINMRINNCDLQFWAKSKKKIFKILLHHHATGLFFFFENEAIWRKKNQTKRRD